MIAAASTAKALTRAFARLVMPMRRAEFPFLLGHPLGIQFNRYLALTAEASGACND
jgi:hypothetical protein